MMGSIIGIALILLAGVVWPGVLGQFISLDWLDGDLRPVCRMTSLLLLAAGSFALLFRHRIAAAWTQRFPTRRITLFKFGTLVVWSVIGLAIAEVGMRFANIPFTRHSAPSDKALAQFDADLGWSYIPGLSTTSTFGDSQREVSMHFDAIGARVASPDVILDASAPTVILVGGSLTMGHGVKYEESLAGQLEATPGFDLQVVNLAIQGQGTDQAFIRLRNTIDMFNTRAVVYGFICDHMLRNSVPDRHLLRPNLWYVATKPMFGFASDGSLRQVAFPQLFEDLEYMRIAAVLRVLWARHGPRPQLDLTRALVREMRELTVSRGAQFVLLDWVIGPPEPYCLDERFDAMGLNVVDTLTDAPADWFDWRIPGDGHPQPRGHTRVASLVFDELEQLGVVTDGTTIVADP